MAKYDSLRAHLAGLDEVSWAARIEEIEEILGSRLPSSATKHRTWWANSGGNLVHQNAWLDAGWRVERADLSRGVIHFNRARFGGRAIAGTQAERPPKPSSATLSKARLAKVHEALGQPVTVTLRAEWTHIGPLSEVSERADWITDKGALLRMVFIGRDDPSSILISCDRLRDAVGTLRSMGQPESAGSATDLSELEALSTNALAEVHILRPGNAWLLADGRGRKADLEEKEERAMVAQLLLMQERQSGRGQRLLSL